MTHKAVGQVIVIGEKGRHIGTKRDPRRAGKRRKVSDQFGFILIGERKRVGEDQAALGVGIADLDGDTFARGVNIPRPERGAGDRVLYRGDQYTEPDFQIARHVMCANASAVAAPPMSFFMLSMDDSGLMSRPPVSKQTPLPTREMRG